MSERDERTAARLAEEYAGERIIEVGGREGRMTTWDERRLANALSAAVAALAEAQQALREALPWFEEDESDEAMDMAERIRALVEPRTDA